MVTYFISSIFFGPKFLSSKSKFSAALHFAGSFLGVVVINLVGGYLAFWFGWPSIFYFSALSNIFCICLWLYLVYDSPEEHTTISEKEKGFILDSRKGLAKRTGEKIPYGEILASLPAWAMIIGHTTSNWGQYTILTRVRFYQKILFLNYFGLSFYLFFAISNLNPDTPSKIYR